MIRESMQYQLLMSVLNAESDDFLTLAELAGLDIKYDFAGSDLREVNLSGADLTGCDFSNADLSSANLSQSNLSRASLRGANLSSANLTNADLNGADLGGANLEGAILKGTKLVVKVEPEEKVEEEKPTQAQSANAEKVDDESDLISLEELVGGTDRSEIIDRLETSFRQLEKTSSQLTEERKKSRRPLQSDAHNFEEIRENLIILQARIYQIRKLLQLAHLEVLDISRLVTVVMEINSSWKVLNADMRRLEDSNRLDRGSNRGGDRGSGGTKNRRSRNF